MDKFLAVIVLIVVIAIFVCGEDYFKLDRSRSLLSVLMSKMESRLQEWMDIASELFDHCGREYFSLYKELSGTLALVPKNKLYQYSGTVNEIHSLAKHAIAENVNDPVVMALARKLSDRSQYLAFPIDDFNKEAAALNRRLDRPLSARIGKLMRIEEVEPLEDLSVL